MTDFGIMDVIFWIITAVAVWNVTGQLSRIDSNTEIIKINQEENKCKCQR